MPRPYVIMYQPGRRCQHPHAADASSGSSKRQNVGEGREWDSSVRRDQPAAQPTAHLLQQPRTFRMRTNVHMATTRMHGAQCKHITARRFDAHR